MKTLKLNMIEKNLLDNKTANQVKGGYCACGCYYAGQGGSSVDSNGSANKSGNLQSENIAERDRWIFFNTAPIPTLDKDTFDTIDGTIMPSI